MAKLKTVCVELLGEVLDIPIKCNASGVFSVGFDTMSWNSVSDINQFKTMEDAVRELKRVVSVLNAIKTEKEDIIFYRVHGQDFSRFSGTSEITTILEMHFVALRKETRGKRVQYFVITDVHGYEPDKNPHGIAPGYRVANYTYNGDLIKAHQIPFSVEAIDFLKKMRIFMQELRQKMDDFTAPDKILTLLATDMFIGLPFNLSNEKPNE